MPEWTAAQQAVIQSEAPELICSAAAGSGKTAVMIERIVRLLRGGAEPDSFLIMTFTNAAAAEMKEKIRNRLYQEKNNPVLREALDRIDSMQISTIHAFCQQLIRNQFQLVDLDPDFQICDASQSRILFHQAFQDACGQMEKNHPEQFRLLKSRFELKKAEALIQNLYPFLMSQPNPMEWMKQVIDSIPFSFSPEHPWMKCLLQMAQEQLMIAEIHLHRMYVMFQEPFSLESFRETWKKDAELLHVKQENVLHPGHASGKAEFARQKTVKGLTVQESDWKDRYGKLRDEYKKKITRADELLLNDAEKTVREWQNMKESLQVLQLFIQTMSDLFQIMKKSRVLADFQDLEQYAVQILQDPRGAEEARSAWRYVFIDECQDNSAVQNKIIELLQHPENHLFMVGDIKQSIYRFRLAEPMQFIRKIQDYRNDQRNREVIYLQSNFRSRPEILETTNRVFRSVMKEGVTEITYGPEEELVAGRKTEGYDPVQIIRIDRGQQDLSSLEATAAFLQDEILTLLQTPYPEKGRNYQYRDMVILMPAVHTDGPLLAQELEKRNIPVFYDGSGDYYQLREIQMIRNLLEWIDYPLQDLPLISVLQENPFLFTEEELSVIRLKYPEKDIPFYRAFARCAEETSDLGERCRQVEKKRVRWQQLAEGMHVSELIWQLYHETGIYYILGSDPAGEVKQANLRMLAQQAADAESRGIRTLRQFLSHMRDQQAYGEQQSATLLGDQDDLVRIMTVHKSKGLQFPVVFCAGMDKSPLGKDPAGILAHSELGLCMDYKDPDHRISRPTLASAIFQWKRRREEMAEKVRLLYVAMTRPQEKLYMMTCQETNPLWSMPESDGRILLAESFTDWWMPVMMQENAKKISTGYAHDEKPYEIRTFEINQQKIVENVNNIHSLAGWLEATLSAPVVDNLWKKTEEQKEPPVLVKRSVTSLVRSAQQEVAPEEEEDLEEETAEKKRMPDALSRRLKTGEMPDMPAFMKKEGKGGAAWRGTLTHRILSLMDLEKMRRGIPPEEVLREEKERMIRNHMATPQELEQVSDAQIAGFWKSGTGQRILQSPEVHREWNFNLLIRREEPMILQGVIDCVFREGEEWVILDYKTDSVRKVEELKEKYTAQVMWYAKAVGELTGRKVKEASLYALSKDALLRIL